MSERGRLLSEGVAEKFMRYVRINTESSDLSSDTPSTHGQWDLARMAADELRELGLADVEVDENCFVIGRLPANARRPAPAVGFLAHLDTSEAVPGAGVTPVLHRAYAGGDIQVGHGVVLKPSESPALARAIGHDIITSDGSTLLGTDDKAGMAAIMLALTEMIKNPEVPHPDVWVAFTPDEETGKGIEKFPYSKFGAKVAYTLDGGPAGEFCEETFNAVNGVAVVSGISSHPGTARGNMVNALHVASALIASIPASWRPETTSGREGFIHPIDIEGNVEKVSIKFIVRDFDSAGLKARERAFVKMMEAIEENNPGSKIEWVRSDGYRNMKEKLDSDPRVSSLALEAIKMAGLEPVTTPIRGGTDGARMSFNGVLTPNLFTGGGDAHSRREWVSVQWMEKAAEVVVNVARLWLDQE